MPQDFEQEQQLREQVGERIKLLRKRDDMTQVELGKQLGYNSSGAVSQIERGDKGISREKLMHAAAIFNVPLAVFYIEDKLDEEELFMVVNFCEVMRNPESPYYNIMRDILKIASEEMAKNKKEIARVIRLRDRVVNES